MNDDDLIEHALCALQEAQEYLQAISYYDSDLAQCNQQIQDCFDILNGSSDEEE